MLDVPAYGQTGRFVHLVCEVSRLLEARVQLDALEAGPHPEFLTSLIGILAILYLGCRVELVSHVGRVLRLVVLRDVE